MRLGYSCRRCAVLTMALLGMSLWPSVTVAELLVYDGFDYADGESLQGQEGGTGFWDGPWTDGSESPDGFDGGDIVEGTMTYTDANGNQLATSGGHVISTQSAGYRVIDTAAIDPSLTVDVAEPGEDPAIRLGRDNTTLWASFKYMSPNEAGEGSWGGLSLYDGDYAGNGNPVDLGDGTGIRPYGTRGDFGGEKGDSGLFAISSHRNGDNVILSDVPVNEESLVVLRFDFFEDTGDDEGADQVYMWLNPLLDAEPDKDDATQMSYEAEFERNGIEYIDRFDMKFDRIRLTSYTFDAIYDELRIGTTFSDVAPIAGGGLIGDFNKNGVLDLPDIDDLTVQSASGANLADYDLNADSLVNSADVVVWIEDLANSWIGDADLDGEFNTNDLVTVLASGTYEQDVDSVWSQGDFDGNGRSNTGDLVVALAGGGYEVGPRAAVAAVPEPSSLALILIGVLATIGSSRRRT